MPSKHVEEELREIIKNVRDGSFEYRNRDEAETNWAKYDYAQIKEMANYLDNLRDIVDEADKRIRSRTKTEKRAAQEDQKPILRILLKHSYCRPIHNRLTEWQKDYCFCFERN